MPFVIIVSFQGMLINVASFLRLSTLSRKSPRENIKTIHFFYLTVEHIRLKHLLFVYLITAKVPLWNRDVKIAI